MKPRIRNINSLVLSITILVALPAFFSCSGVSNKNKPQEQKKQEEIPNVYKKPPSSFNDTLIISGKSAVFYNSDSEQLEKIKTLINKDEYETEVHNCFYLMRNARIEMKQFWPTIHIIETSSHRYLQFVKTDKTKVTIDLNSIGDQCGIYLFDGKKNPALADMMNIDTALGFYFSKQTH